MIARCGYCGHDGQLGSEIEANPHERNTTGTVDYRCRDAKACDKREDLNEKAARKEAHDAGLDDLEVL